MNSFYQRFPANRKFKGEVEKMIGNESNTLKIQKPAHKAGKAKSIKAKLLIGMVALTSSISILSGTIFTIFLANNSKDTGSTDTAITITVALTIVFIVLSCIVSVKIADSIVNPIIALVQRIESLADGDLHTRVPAVKAKGEVQTLSTAFADTINLLNGYISEISRILGNMSKGDFTVTITQDYKGDFVAIKTALNTIVTSLHTMFVDINKSADEVANGANQVSSGAQALSQGATEQASTIEQLSASIQEIADQVKQSAANASSANQFAAQSTQEVDNGNEHMKQMIAAMDEISESSKQIGAIIKAIQNIAFQTNILALNAAVEAARAGEAGKGFAVVADEVRNLAGKSAEAAKNTTALIENSIRAVEKGQRIADETAKSLNAIIAGTQQTSELIRQISESANEQATSINQVTLGVEQISGVVQTNSATAEQSAATSEELSGQAQLLKQNLAHLKLTKTEEKAQAARTLKFYEQANKKAEAKAIEPAAKPAAQAVAEPVTEKASEPVATVPAEPTPEKVPEPAAAPTVESAGEPVTEPTATPTVEPAAEVASEPVSGVLVEPVIESAPESLNEPAEELEKEPELAAAGADSDKH